MFSKPFIGTAPDYSRAKNWLNLPERVDKAVDLIFLYPSSCLDPKSNVICDIDDPSMVEGAKRYFAQEASVFEPIANLFAPYAITAEPGFEVFEPVFGPASYHGCDYSFFYLNIRENARLRAKAWFEK